MFGLQIGCGDELTTKNGIDKIELMLAFMKLLDGDNADKHYDEFKSFLELNLKRNLHPTEDLNLCEGVLKFLQSEEGSNERINAMEYLFETKFLND